MARAGILYSHVATAATKLIEEGKNPTVDTVREALGSTGSKSTIAPYLKRWKEAHQGAVAQIELGVPPTLLQAVKGIYESMQAEFSQKLELVKQAHQAQIHAAADEAQRLRAENIVSSEANSSLSASLERANETIARVQAENHSLSITLASVQSENVGLQQRLVDRAAEVTALNQQLTQSRGQFEHYQESIAAQRAAERQAAEQRTTRLDQELASAHQRLVAQQSTIGNQEARLAQSAADGTRLRERLRIIEVELTDVRAENTQLSYRAGELGTESDQRSAQLESLQSTLSDTKMALAGQVRETDMLTGQLRRAEESAAVLSEERLALFQKCAAFEAQVRQATPSDR